MRHPSETALRLALRLLNGARETDTDRSDGDKDRKLEAAKKQRQIRRQSGRLKKPRRWSPGDSDEVDYFRMTDITGQSLPMFRVL